MDVVLREANDADAEAIAAVHVGTWQAAYRGLVPDDYLDALDLHSRVQAYRQSRMFEDADRPMWVAECAGTIVGFVGVGASRDEPDVGELYSIYVSADRWGTGAGRALMIRGVDWLRSRYAQATLWVLEGNERARRFYERGGWRLDGTTKDDDRGSFVLREVRYRIDL
jgi:GNAT superfamily N-acetyltransferase